MGNGALLPLFRLLGSITSRLAETANEIARKAGEIRMVGEAVRWIDLAATRNEAMDIFDRIPKNVSEAERAKWAEERCEMIRAGCRRNHGVTIQHFIEHVMRKRKTVQEKVLSLRKAFVERVTDANDDPVVRHLAKCFGHIYAAGIIGVRFGTAMVGETGAQVHREMLWRCAARAQYRSRPAARWAENPACEDARIAEGEWRCIEIHGRV
jgi:hypothetical protein